MKAVTVFALFASTLLSGASAFAEDTPPTDDKTVEQAAEPAPAPELAATPAPSPSVPVEQATPAPSEPVKTGKAISPQSSKKAPHAAKKPPTSKAAPKVSKPKVPTVRSATIKPPHPAKPKDQGSTKPISAFELGRYQYCGSDRDCRPAVNGCCDCANGGEDVSVNRERYEAFRARFSCLNVSCGTKQLEPQCGSGVVSCVNHKCRFISDRGLEDKF